jgi:20S proteasome subunit alpha 1
MSNADRTITVFTQEGRLLQVEYAFKAVKQSEVTAIGAKGKTAVVVAVQKKIQDTLIDPTTVTHMFRITEHVGSCLVGLLPDVIYIARRLRYDAILFERKNGFEIPVSQLAARLSEIHQFETQHVAYRPTAVAAIIFGHDLATNDFALYRIDPSGTSCGYRAVAAGVKETEAMSALEKKIQPFEDEKTLSEFVLSTLQTVVGMDFEAKELEVAVINWENKKFRLLDSETVDEILKGVAEKD